MHSTHTFLDGRRPPVRGLIFDMDGTILDTRAYHMKAWRELVAAHGLEQRHYEVAEKGFGKTNGAIFHQWYREDAAEHDFDALGEEKEALFRQLIRGKVRPRPGFIELVQWSRLQGMRIALATSAPRANAEFLLEDTGIVRLFDAVFCCDTRAMGKPHPDPFLKAALRLGVAPGHCVVFEDSAYGFLSARRAGMRLVAIAEQPADRVRIRKWTPFVFTDFRPVPAVLANWM